VDSYQGLVNSAADASASRLNGIHASKQHDAAQKSLDGVYATLQAAEQTSDLKTAVKLIGQANMKLVSTGKLIDAAAKAPQPPAPPAGVTATVSGATSWSFKSTGAAAVEQSANNVLVNSAQAITKAPYGQRTITFALNGLQPGANTITAVGGSTFMVTEIYATGGAGGTGASYSGKSGNIQVNYNQSANTVSGTFDVSCEDERSPGRVISVKGSFSATIRK
jgi:hypothetical protein